MVDIDAGVISYSADESRALGYYGKLEFPLAQANKQFYVLMQARTIRLDTARAHHLGAGVMSENEASLEILSRIADELLPVVMTSLVEDIIKD
jgi:hypothetical protein